MTMVPSGPLVKICGLRTPELAQATSDAGADLIGFVFASSRRQVTAEQARDIIEALDGPAVPVGLFVDHSVEEINTTARRAGLEILQLHWRADESDFQRFELPYYAVRRTEPGATYDEIAPELDRLLSSPNPPLWIMVDAYHPTQSGGTGHLADWELSRRLAASFPLMLAGGLNPENVANAIAQVRPAHVDVSSGVEVDGIKSPELVRAFVANARAAFDTYSSASEITVQS
ncbi:MAG: phosphoribosylanthranilate isomerase [Thermomicrobiales bacterium]